MDYISTRGKAPVLDFEGATLAGLASDGGLYVPTHWPRLSRETLRGLSTASYVDTAVTVLTPFVGASISQEELRRLCENAYARFRHRAIAPLVQLDNRQWMLELHHGPTLAFKDMALQWLGALFEFFLKRRGEQLTIIGATSGDTGSAAIEALAGQTNVRVFMIHPAGRVSEVQRRQMTTVLAPNIHNIAINGTFDDAQAIAKALLSDSEMRSMGNLSAINSINWARLAAQTVYYVYAGVRLGAPDRKLTFSVPTGNFGDVYAGYVASQMGLPISRLIVATNVNDILHRALSQGDYSVGTVARTEAPSMDIQISSNFERLLFDLSGGNGSATAKRMRMFETTGAITMPEGMRRRAERLLLSDSVDTDRMREAMRWADDACGLVIDPHSAIGLAAAQAAARLLPDTTPIVTLATAHPAKFRESVERATGGRPGLPSCLAGLFDRQESYVTLPADMSAVRDHILQTPCP